ncbi:MAG: DUF2723 domain-containing protein [Bacteroidales bacterium]|nr:DUF2723 domain-containing protein [Bacteroidales bacterium]MBN2820857.1 DUF2723 domain-containing protein [Bacteroidales bacterium]
MNTFKTYNRILGWAVFVIAAITYILTAEPTVSLWDCGEFIASAYKLQVGHPPGAPLFMIMARVFTLFAGSDVTKVAFMVNVMSALASAFTIMFLFWTITHLALKITGRDNLKPYQLIAVLGSGLVGALAYTFSDTFWFSAVEGEVYASSSFFTAIVFWAILKWENIADEKYSNRWLIFIAYLMGLSIGVHLLNLLAIPAIVMVYYFKKYETSRKGVIWALIIGGLILGFVMYGIIPGIIWLASIFELLFVNGFGLPFNSGILIYIVLLLSGLAYGIYYTQKNGKVALNTAILMVTVIVIGYSSYSMIVIRSMANPPMDENSPETIFKLQSYLNREQYGERPLVSGQYFNAPVTEVKEGKNYYTRKDGKYVVTNRKTEYVYDSDFTGLFPRMWSSDNTHIPAYMQWGKIDEKDIYQPKRDQSGNLVTDRNGRIQYDRNNPKDKPTMVQNLRYFFSYQVNFMYMRYFWWNFVGRQNDEQGYGGIINGNWASGIPFIDHAKLGDGKNPPPEIKNHPAHNEYYALPFLLGLIGLIYHYRKHKKDAWIVMMLFVLTGLAIVVYLSQYPFQPRERDYAYAGSFYAYAIWIGLGVLAIIDMAGKALKNVPASAGVTVVLLFLVPGIMARENWDDHDRSGRYTARDIAYNYLMSCAPNAILFTNGDNDTFPLWYVQEVEGVRTDVRIVNLMLLNMDWYADQMKLKVYESEPLPISLKHEQYLDGTRDVVFIQEQYKEAYPAKQILEFIASDHKATKVKTQANKEYDYCPTRSFLLPVDKEKVIANGTVKPEDAPLIEDTLLGHFSGSRLTKSDLIAFDIITTNNWERPVYFVSYGHSGLLGLDNYLQLDGFAYRLVPIKTTDRYEKGRIDSDILYKNFMEEFQWRGMGEDDAILDHFHLRTLNVIRLRMRYARLANQLILEGDLQRAEAVLDRVTELTPPSKVPYDYFIIPISEGYYRLNKFDKANEILSTYLDMLEGSLDYYLSMSQSYQQGAEETINQNFEILLRIGQLAHRYNQEELANRANDYLQSQNLRY